MRYDRDIDTESRHSLLHREVEYAVHGLVYFWIAPVQIRLLYVNVVIVVLPGLVVPLPSRVPKP
jgi:hypothetical protein